MKKLDNLNEMELDSLNQIHGGKKTPSYNLVGVQTDVKKWKRNGQLKWVKTFA